MEPSIHWYVLYTSPRAEKQVRDRLQAKGIDCWLPLHRTPRKWSDRVKMIDIPLYNSYIFVHTTEANLHELYKVYGVNRIVHYNGKPAIIRQNEIDAIKYFLQQAAERTLVEGEEVEILCGSLKNISGVVKTIKRKHLILFIESINATVCVSLEVVSPKKRLY